MVANTLSTGRDVHIYDANGRTTVVGGLILTHGVTKANFYSMVEIICIFDEDYFLQDESGVTVERDNSPLQPGNFYIVKHGPVTINDEPWLLRTVSLASGTRLASFRDAVRDRDRRCVITGRRVVSARGLWTGFQAAHIFPLAYERHWMDHNYSRWITIHPSTGCSINSVQNGILLDSTIHALFDTYAISINPDDNYKIVCFDIDGFGVAGKHLDQEFIEDPRRPVDKLLRWHFRQAVLANMRTGGEPVFELDFPPGSDMVGEILRGPKAAERMEFELFSRFAVK